MSLAKSSAWTIPEETIRVARAAFPKGYPVIRIRDLQHEWAVQQIYPSGAADNFVAFDPGQELVIPLRASLPKGYRTGRDVLKVFATVGTTNFRWLELPAPDRPPAHGGVTRGGRLAAPLEQMFAAFAADRLPAPDLKPAAVPGKEWVAAQVELNIRQA
jgi:hypothetical protein